MARLQSAARSRFRMATVSRHCIGLMGAQSHSWSYDEVPPWAASTLRPCGWAIPVAVKVSVGIFT